MLKNIRLTIPQACHEDWQQMTPVEKGRYCAACKKNVVDFTNMSDREILNYVSTTSSGFYGRLHRDQLSRSIELRRESRIPWLKYFFHFTLPAFLISLKAQGQNPDKKADTVQAPLKFNKADEIFSDTSSIMVRGRVVDEEGKPVIGASVMIKGTSIGTVTNEEGYYSIGFKDNMPIVLEISSVGYMLVELSTTPEKNAQVILTKALEVFAGGILVIEGPRPKKKPKRSALEIIRTVITPDSVKLSPNPLGAGNNINIEMNFVQPGEYIIEMVDLSGRCVKKQNIQSDAQLFRTSLGTAGLQPGNYVVYIRNRKGKKICAKKIIVQH